MKIMAGIEIDNLLMTCLYSLNFHHFTSLLFMFVNVCVHTHVFTVYVWYMHSFTEHWF